MKRFLIFVYLSITMAACATPGVKTTYDEFSGGEVTQLTANQLDTPGWGDVYFNAEAVKDTEKNTVSVIGAFDYEADQRLGFKIDVTKDLVILADDKRIVLRPIKDTGNVQTAMGMVAARHVHSQKYSATIEDLTKIANSKTARMKIFINGHKDGGLTGSFKPRNYAKLKEFVAVVSSTEAKKDQAAQ